MLFKTKFSALIKAQKIETAIRKWTRPTVKENGTLITAAGQIRIISVRRSNTTRSPTKKSSKQVTQTARSWTMNLTAEVLAKFIESNLSSKEKIPVSNYGRMRIFPTLNWMPCKKSWQALDARSKTKGWPLRILEAINKEPGLLAIQHAKKLGYEKMWFKLHVRKLKNLGLTISLERGYKISPRGKVFLESVK